MLWLSSLWRPPEQPGGREPPSLAARIVTLAYVLVWLAVGIALYVNWTEWPGYVKYSLAAIEAIFAPDLKGIRDTLSGRPSE
jgi:hypothetical protein